jgi:predicted protein tyrosine phosphatase
LFAFIKKNVPTADRYNSLESPTLTPPPMIVWADVILVMDAFQQLHINTMQNKLAEEADVMFEYEYKRIINLEIDDIYEYRSPKLVEIMTEKFKELFPLE